jgi:hypothetical protein
MKVTSLGSGAVLAGFEAAAWAFDQAKPVGEVLGQVPSSIEGPVDMDAAFGSVTDGRLYSSLDGMDEKSLVVPGRAILCADAGIADFARNGGVENYRGWTRRHQAHGFVDRGVAVAREASGAALARMRGEYAKPRILA